MPPCSSAFTTIAVTAGPACGIHDPSGPCFDSRYSSDFFSVSVCGNVSAARASGTAARTATVNRLDNKT